MHAAPPAPQAVSGEIFHPHGGLRPVVDRVDASRHPVRAMNHTLLSVALLPLFLPAGCAVENPARAERARDARLAILQPARLTQGPRETTAAPTSTDCDNPAPPDAAEKKKCQDHDRHGDKPGKCEHDSDKHEQGSR